MAVVTSGHPPIGNYGNYGNYVPGTVMYTRTSTVAYSKLK
jgi:hypothetical protein